MRSLFVFASILLASCAQLRMPSRPALRWLVSASEGLRLVIHPSVPRLEGGVDSQLEPLLAQFREDYRSELQVDSDPLENVDEVRFLEPKALQSLCGAGTMACCVTVPYGIGRFAFFESNRVFLSSSMSPGSTKLAWALYHELGHCLFALEHDSEGIMQEVLPKKQEREPLLWKRAVGKFFQAVGKTGH